jgi:amidohydrolase
MKEEAHALAEQLVEWRRSFHRQPELGFQEYQTSRQVAQVLEELGWRVKTGVGRTGVVAERGYGEPVIAIRADMDALPIQEANDVPYGSQVEGVMHACGHDAHTAMLLGVAVLLSRQRLPGTVRLLFQPSEEAADEEGLSGAPRMIQDGAMQGVSQVLALHVDPAMPVGCVQIGSGAASGGVDSFFASIIGKSGHGAYPHETVDPIYLAAHVILALHGIVSRRLDPLAPAVVSIGSLHGGTAENIIPDRIDCSGTIRFMQPAVQQQIHSQIKQAFKVACTLGGDYELRFETGSQPMYNHPQAVDLLEQAAEKVIGIQNILPPVPTLGAEDFGDFSALAPGAMFSLGCRIEGDERMLHNANFDINEACLPIGTAILAQAVVDYLHSDR